MSVLSEIIIDPLQICHRIRTLEDRISVLESGTYSRLGRYALQEENLFYKWDHEFPYKIPGLDLTLKISLALTLPTVDDTNPAWLKARGNKTWAIEDCRYIVNATCIPGTYTNLTPVKTQIGICLWKFQNPAVSLLYDQANIRWFNNNDEPLTYTSDGLPDYKVIADLTDEGEDLGRIIAVEEHYSYADRVPFLSLFHVNRQSYTLTKNSIKQSGTFASSTGITKS